MTYPTQIGVIGIGAMGMGVAKALVRKGWRPYVRDIKPAREAEARSAGAIVCNSSQELAAHCDIVITLVVDAQQTDAVLFGADGAAAALRQGSVVIMSSTVVPDYATQLAARLAQQGISMLDAPVSGGPAKALSGEMSMMAAGSSEAFAKCETVLAAITGKLFRISAVPGDGSKTKIVNNMLAGTQLVAAAEAITLGAQLGLDLDTLFEVICNSSGASWVFADRIARVLKEDYAVKAALDILKKDLSIATAAAQQNNVPTPVANAALAMFTDASAAGLGGEDDAALVKYYRQLTRNRAST
jgi:L-threonate 2-dehydrogenase